VPDLCHCAQSEAIRLRSSSYGARKRLTPGIGDPVLLMPWALRDRHSIARCGAVVLVLHVVPTFTGRFLEDGARTPTLLNEGSAAFKRICERKK
jgi:hypothetical protein